MRFIYLFLLLLFCFSCSVTKRIYRNGYHVDWVGSGKEKKGDEQTSFYSTNKAFISIVTDSPKKTIRIVASAKPVVSGFKPGIKKLTSPPDTCSDIVCLKNGTDIEATIIELTEEKIRYKRCDKVTTGIIETKKEDVLMVKFANGTIENYNNEPALSNPKVHPLAVLAFASALIAVGSLFLAFTEIFFLILLAISTITGLVSGFAARKTIKQYPEVYRGRFFANFGIVVCTVLSILLLIVAASL